MAAWEWTLTVRAVRDTPVVDYSTPGVNTMRRVAYPPPNAVFLILLALLVCEGIRQRMASYERISVDTVANVDDNIVE